MRAIHEDLLERDLASKDAFVSLGGVSASEGQLTGLSRESWPRARVCSQTSPSQRPLGRFTAAPRSSIDFPGAGAAGAARAATGETRDESIVSRLSFVRASPPLFRAFFPSAAPIPLLDAPIDARERIKVLSRASRLIYLHDKSRDESI